MDAGSRKAMVLSCACDGSKAWSCRSVSSIHGSYAYSTTGTQHCDMRSAIHTTKFLGRNGGRPCLCGVCMESTAGYRCSIWEEMGKFLAGMVEL